MAISNFEQFEPNIRESENVTIEKILITPEIASEMLNHNLRNRHIRRRLVDHYAEIMERGEWLENGETIKFAKNGVLLDGQHRLLAIVLSGFSQNIIVVRGLDVESYTTIDIGAHRTGADFFKYEGELYSTLLNAALRLLWFYREYGNFSTQTRKPTFEQLYQLLNLESTIRDSVKEADRLNRKIRGVTPSTLAVLHHLLSNIDELQANIFFEKLASGIGFNSETDPIYRLYERFHDVDLMKLTSKSANNMRAALLIKAWNAYRKNKPVKVLVWNHRKDTIEGFPIPE
jgi:hypothetical protein